MTTTTKNASVNTTATQATKQTAVETTEQTEIRKEVFDNYIIEHIPFVDENGETKTRKRITANLVILPSVLVPGTTDRYILRFDKKIPAYDKDGIELIESENIGLQVLRMYQLLNNPIMNKALLFTMGKTSEEINTLLAQIGMFSIIGQNVVLVKEERFKGEKRQETNDYYTNNCFVTQSLTINKVNENLIDYDTIKDLFTELREAVKEANNTSKGQKKNAFDL